MRRSLPIVLLVMALLFVTACQRTVSPEGYVSETPVEKYVRNLPTAYGGQRSVVLKPPVTQPAPAMTVQQTYIAPIEPAHSASAYTSQPLSPPVVMVEQHVPVIPAPIAPSRDWNTLPAYDGTLPGQDPTPLNKSSYAPSPALNNLMSTPQYITPPSNMVTREVNYGREITVYPLDRADAPMPYIPPATTHAATPGVKPAATKIYKKQSPAEFNQ